MPTLFRPRPGHNLVDPGIQGREVIQRNTRPGCTQLASIVAFRNGPRTLTASSHPTPAGKVGNGALVTNKVARLGLAQVLIHDTVQAPRLVLVSVDAVLDLLRSIS